MTSVVRLITLWQVEEETGICLKQEDVVDLTAFLDQSTGCRIFPSPVSWCQLLSSFRYKPECQTETQNVGNLSFIDKKKGKLGIG